MSEFSYSPDAPDEEETVTISKKRFDSLEAAQESLKRNVEGQLEKAAVLIDKRQNYERYDTKEIDLVLMKKNPGTFNYSSNDLWNMGKYRINGVLASHGTLIFNHWDPKKKEKNNFKAPLLATYLQIIHPIVTIRPEQYSQKDSGDMNFWDWDTAQYRPNAELYLGEHIKDLYRDGFNPRILSPTWENVRLETYINRDEFTLSPEFIPTKNSLLWVHKVGDEWIIDEAESTPELYITSRLPVIYNPDATCPRWLQFLDEILPGQQQEIDWLQEYVGYSLYRSWDFDRVILLLGDGENGKSTLLDVIRFILGNENCTTIGLYDLCNGRWYTAELYKKLANIDADTATKDLENTSRFKTVTGGDRVMGERKGKNPFFFDSYAKHFMSANKMPYCYDDTDAFYRRWFIIKFFVQFKQGDPRRDPQLKQKLLAEQEGILIWALKGLLRLLGNNQFSDPPSTTSVKAEWNRLSNPVYSFIYSPGVVIDSDGEYILQDFYEDYIEYCKTWGLITWTKDKVGKRMNYHFDFVEKVRSYNPSDPKNRPWAWKGIRKPTGAEAETQMGEYS
jgi:P4 family phage/plasmid primase-like protien